MGSGFLVMLREGLEAALIVAIVLAYLRRLDRKDEFGRVWLGTGAAVAVSWWPGQSFSPPSGNSRAVRRR